MLLVSYVTHNSKFSNINHKIQPYRRKLTQILLFEWLSLRILKHIIGYEDKIAIIKVHALEFPFSRLILSPAIGVCLIFLMVMIIFYLPNLLDIALILQIVIFIILWGIALIISSPFNYYLSPFSANVDDFFKVNGALNTVIEYRFGIKILYVSLPLMLCFSFLTYFFTTQNSIELTNDDIVLRSVLIIMAVASSAISIAWILKFGLLILQKKFRFYLAKYSLGLGIEISNEYEKLQYVIFGLNSYNIYLKKQFKFHFKNIARIFEQIISDSTEDMNNIIKELYNKLDLQNVEIIRYLAKHAKLDDRVENFLTRTTPKEKITEWGPIIAIISSISYSLIQSVPVIIDILQGVFQNLS